MNTSSEEKAEKAKISLPDVVTLRLKTKDLDEEQKNVLRVLYERHRSDLPFSLPRFTSWPTGERRQSERAMLLMLNGFYDLCENYPKNKAGASAHQSSQLITQQIDPPAPTPEPLERDEDGFPLHRPKNVTDTF